MIVWVLTIIGLEVVTLALGGAVFTDVRFARRLHLYPDDVAVRVSYPEVVVGKVYVCDPQASKFEGVGGEEFGGTARINVLLVAQFIVSEASFLSE